MNNYTEISVDQITPDPNQPRKYFDGQKIKELASTIKSNIKEGKGIKGTGIINAIEVDPNYMIITGERRWRASKIAGLKIVPVKIVSGLSPEERYWRQGVENWASQNMTHMERAVWLYKNLKEMGWSYSRATQQYERGRGEKGKEGFQSKDETEKYIEQIANKLGGSKDTIYDHLQLLEEKENVKKHLEENNTAYGVVREINARKLDPELENKLKAKVIDGTLKEGLTARHLIGAIKERPDLKDELIAEDYSQGGFARNIEKIGAIKSRKTEPNGESKRAWSEIVEALIDIEDLLGQADYQHIRNEDKEKAITTAKKIIEQMENLVTQLEGKYLN